jgi:hypothetical protein
MSYRVALRYGIIGATAGCVGSALMNYFVIPLPVNIQINAINHGISGLISGFIGAFPSVLLYMKSQKKIVEEVSNTSMAE